jgi:hypothetical protein
MTVASTLPECEQRVSARGDVSTFGLLLALAKPTLSPKEEEAVRQCLSAEDMDWRLLLELAEWHRTLPRMTARLNAFSEHVPRRVVEILRASALETARTNIAFTTELLRISACLRSNNIPHLAYKGPALAVQLYGDISARSTSDIDLLVLPDYVEASRDALLELEYRDKNGLSKAQQAASFRYGFEHSFCRDNGTVVDLHWRVVPYPAAPSLDVQGIWKRASLVCVFDQDVPTFCPEDLLVVLCLHAAQHEWSHIGAFNDIARLISNYPSLSWEIVRGHMRDSNTVRAIAVSLLFVRKYWDVELPDEIVHLIAQDSHAATLAEHIRATMWPACRFPTSFRWAVQRSRGERWRDRIRFLRTFLTPAVADYEALRLPRPLISLYPAFRILRLAFKYTLGKVS